METGSIIVLGEDGLTKKFPTGADGAFPDRETLDAAGFAGQSVRFLKTHPADLPAAAPRGPRKVLLGTGADSGYPVPPVPQPDGPKWVAPPRSEELLASNYVYWPDGTSNTAPLVYAKDFDAYIPVDSASPKLTPKFPKPQRLEYRTYWVSVEHRSVRGPQAFLRSVTSAEGMASTEEKTFSGEVGVSIKGLSAKVSYSTKNTVTITTSEEITEEYSFEVPDGKTGNWTLWQLCEKFVFTLDDGTPIIWKGKVDIGMAKFDARFENTFGNRLNVYDSNLVLFDV